MVCCNADSGWSGRFQGLRGRADLLPPAAIFWAEMVRLLACRMWSPQPTAAVQPADRVHCR